MCTVTGREFTTDWKGAFQYSEALLMRLDRIDDIISLPYPRNLITAIDAIRFVNHRFPKKKDYKEKSQKIEDLLREASRELNKALTGNNKSRLAAYNLILQAHDELWNLAWELNLIFEKREKGVAALGRANI